MAEKANITPIGSIEAFDAADTRPDMVRVEHVSMVFNMASEQLNNLKEYAIALARRELMFKEFRALDDVSLEVKKGDVFGIMGTNGSGKSTLLKIIAGVLEPTEGTVQINGNIAPLIELGAGFDMDLTARENIYLNGALLGYPKRFIAQHFDEIVEFAEIEQFLDMPLKNYSSGMVARIAFAIATVVVPDILIVDEVLSVGDFMFQQKCERRIQNLIKEHGVTVLIVSHNNDQIERLCNKAIWIEKGHTRMIGSAKEVCQVYGLVGGHSGSSDAERRVLDMLADPTPVDESLIKTIAGEDRYGTAVKLFDETDHPDAATLVVAPGENIVACMIANSLAGALDTSVLLTKSDQLPDTTESALKRSRAKTILLVGSEDLISPSVASRIEEITDATIHRLDAAAPHELAKTAYRAVQGEDGAWGDTAVIAHPRCTGDMISLMPYRYAQKCPLFFNESDGVIDSETLAHLNDAGFTRIIILGPDRLLPEASFTPMRDRRVETVRLRGEGPYHASVVINEWIKNTTDHAPDELILASDADPVDTLAAGAYAAARNGAILIVDPAYLDSLVNAFDLIAKEKVQRATFLGSSMKFPRQDKELIAKAIRANSDTKSKAVS